MVATFGMNNPVHLLLHNKFHTSIFVAAMSVSGIELYEKVQILKSFKELFIWKIRRGVIITSFREVSGEVGGMD